jgi:nitroreductase
LRGIDVDLDVCLSFVGYAADKGDCILVAGPGGEVRFEGSSGELQGVQDVIRGLDGFTPLRSLLKGDGEKLAQQESVLAALDEVGALLDRACAWHWFHELSSNPAAVPMRNDPLAAYDLPRLTASGDPYGDDPGGIGSTSVDVIAAARVSADLPSAAIDPGASTEAATRLAVCSYLLRADGRRPVASGGALYPLHFWVLGSNGDAAMRQVLSIDHDRGGVKKRGEVSVAHLQQMFVPDPGVAMAIDRGAAVIVIAADPRRVTHKYGSRGWRYALMECGAVMHHIMLTATARGEVTRPVGGYFDLPLQQAVCDPALPLLTILVMAQQ